jgi:Uma2 family endonuclease
MSTIATEADVGQSIVLHGVSWEQYEKLLDAFGNRRLRHTYDRGTLEIMSPSSTHENVKRFMGRLIEKLAEECDVDIRSFGSMTQRKRKKERGLESDECYYFANEPLVRHKRDLDFAIDPPPDLAVEVDVSRSSVGRLRVYASLGVPEIWRCDEDEHVTFVKLVKGGRYTEIERSIAFPFLTPGELQEFVDLRLALSERELIRKFARWVRKKIKP